MRCSARQLLTPLYLKLDNAMPWPAEEKAFYLLSRDGLFLCRNTRFFRSCVPVQGYPSELANQEPFLKLSYPLIPRRLLETAIGFFDIIGERHASEAAVLIAWNQATGGYEIVVPDQVGFVGTTWYGQQYPVELEYEVPLLPSHLTLVGDIHSHVDGPAYASLMDKSDEVHRPGLHLVIGRILNEPPQIHCEAVVDGLRFKVRDLGLVIEGYHRRRVDEVPPEWINKVTVKPWSSRYQCQQTKGDSAHTSAFLNAGCDAKVPEATSLSGEAGVKPGQPSACGTPESKASPPAPLLSPSDTPITS